MHAREKTDALAARSPSVLASFSLLLLLFFEESSQTIVNSCFAGLLCLIQLLNVFMCPPEPRAAAARICTQVIQRQVTKGKENKLDFLPRDV